MNYCVEIEIVVLNFIVFNWVEKDTADGSITGKDATQKGGGGGGGGGRENAVRLGS